MLCNRSLGAYNYYYLRTLNTQVSREERVLGDSLNYLRGYLKVKQPQLSKKLQTAGNLPPPKSDEHRPRDPTGLPTGGPECSQARPPETGQ